MEAFERANLDAYFGRIVAQFPADGRPASFLITHVLPERPAFVRAVSNLTDLRAVLPKPKSIDGVAARQIEADGYVCDRLSRDLFIDPQRAVDYLEARAAGKPVVLLDVGGYFAPVLTELCDRARR